MPDTADILKLARRLNPGVLIRPASSADGQVFEQLMNSQYSRKKPPGYFAWRFEQCPDPSVLMLATNGDDLLGCMGGHIRTLSDGRRVVFSVDLVVQPMARNRGLSLLLEEALEAFGRGNRAVALAAMPNPLGLRSHMGFPGCSTIGFIPTLVQRCNASSPSLSNEFPNSAIRLISFCRDTHYVSWRYMQNPEYRYHRVELGTDAWLIFKHFSDPATGATFVDITDLGASSPTKIHELITQLRHHPSVGDSAALTAWALPHTNGYSTLTSLGFQPEGNARAFCVRPFASETDRDLLRFDTWDVVEGDSELY